MNKKGQILIFTLFVIVILGVLGWLFFVWFLEKAIFFVIGAVMILIGLFKSKKKIFPWWYWMLAVFLMLIPYILGLIKI